MSDSTSAFPSVHRDGSGEPGVALRDWFAGQALVGLLSEGHLKEKLEEFTGPGVEADDNVKQFLHEADKFACSSVANMCYLLADAMIDARIAEARP